MTQKKTELNHQDFSPHELHSGLVQPQRRISCSVCSPDQHPGFSTASLWKHLFYSSQCLQSTPPSWETRLFILLWQNNKPLPWTQNLVCYWLKKKKIDEMWIGLDDWGLQGENKKRTRTAPCGAPALLTYCGLSVNNSNNEVYISIYLWAQRNSIFLNTTKTFDNVFERSVPDFRWNCR